jgi:hypothetical protein
MSPIEAALREALKPVKVTYNPGIGAWENSEEWRCAGWQGEYQWPVRRDPIFTPLFTAILGTGGISLFGTTISYATIASAIATTALTIGVSYALAPKPPKPEDGRQPLTQAVPFRFWGVGETRLAGAMMLWESKGRTMYSVQALIGHRIEAITAYYLNDDKVQLNGSNYVISPGHKRYGDGTPYRVRIFTRLGLVPETPYAELVSALSGDGVWTNDHRGDGQASLAMICTAPKAEDYNQMFPYGKPAASPVMKLAWVWDFRDPDQDPDDPDTWAWSNNSVLILAWHLCFNDFGEKLDFRRAILPVLDMWQEEADVCDEDVSLAVGGTEKRYTCSGYDSAENGPKAGTNAILATMDGWMCTRGDGAVLIVAGKYREKYCVTLTDADIIGYDKQNDVLPDDEVNRLTPKFNYPATDYTTTDTDFFEDTAAQIRAGRVLPQEGNYDWCTQWRQARRLGKRDWIRIQQRVSGTLYAALTGINAAYAPWIRLETPVMIPSLDGKVMSNRRATIDLMHGGFQIDVNKMPDNPADIDAWTPVTDEGSAPPVPAKPVSDGIPVPIIDTTTVLRQANSVYLRIALIDPARDDLTPAFKYRLADDGTGNPGSWSSNQTFPDAEPDSGLLTVDTGAIPGDEEIEYELAYVGANGSYGDYTSIQSVTTTVDTVAPQALLSFTASDGVGQFTANFGTENDSHLATVAIYRIPTGDPAPAVGDTPATRPTVSPGISYAIPVSALTGTWDIYARPFNRSNISGPLAGPETVTVT